MKWLYYKFLCRNIKKKLIFNYKRLKKQETKLLQQYLLLEAMVLVGDFDTLEKHMNQLISLRKTIEKIQEILKSTRTTIKSIPS